MGRKLDPRDPKHALWEMFLIRLLGSLVIAIAGYGLGKLATGCVSDALICVPTLLCVIALEQTLLTRSHIKLSRRLLRRARGGLQNCRNHIAYTVAPRLRTVMPRLRTVMPRLRVALIGTLLSLAEKVLGSLLLRSRREYEGDLREVYEIVRDRTNQDSANYRLVKDHLSALLHIAAMRREQLYIWLVQRFRRLP